MSAVTLRVVRGAAAARETLLRRKALDELEAPPALLASIEAVFGEPLTPDQAVARILADVRARGDDAVRDYSRRIDGAELADLRVPRERIEQAWRRTSPAIREALTEDKEVLVEEFVKGREFDCGVLRDKNKKYVFPITEIIPTGDHEFFDYAAKYDGFSREVTPAEVEGAVSRHIQEVSAQLYDLLGCKGVVRFDYIYSEERRELFFLEVNTIPGQSAESIVPKQARAVGISTEQLYEMIIESSL